MLPRVCTGTPCCGRSILLVARGPGRTIDYHACPGCRHAWMYVLDAGARGAWELRASDLGSMLEWPAGLDLARLDTDRIASWLRLTPGGWLRPAPAPPG